MDISFLCQGRIGGIFGEDHGDIIQIGPVKVGVVLPAISSQYDIPMTTSSVICNSDIMGPIPVTVVTGFLGSGKTTLILNLLPQLPKTYKVVTQSLGPCFLVANAAILASTSEKRVRRSRRGLTAGLISVHFRSSRTAQWLHLL